MPVIYLVPPRLLEGLLLLLPLPSDQPKRSEEGGNSSPQERDWRGMVAALLVILVISSIIGITIVLTTPIGAGSNDEAIDFNELETAEQQFIQKSWWISEDEIAYHIARKGANIYNVKNHNLTRVADTIFSNNYLNESMISYSKDVRYIAKTMLNTETFRDPDRVTFSVMIYDNTNGLKYAVGLSSNPQEILAFKWSHSSAYSFVYQDHVYYAKSPEEVPISITSKDETGFLHGTFDWVYNEEIYSRSYAFQGAMWFSPSDNYLAYASRPIKSSKEILMTTFTRGDLYNYHYHMEYPKTGEKRLPVYTLSIWNEQTRKTRTMDVQLRDSASYHYLFGVSWVSLHGKEMLVATWANRWQNVTALTLCSYEKATCSLLYEHKYDVAQWATPSDYENLVHSNSTLFVLLPKSKNGNAYQHIAKIEITPEFTLRSVGFVQSGEYDVRQIVAYREKEDLIFYSAQAPTPWQKHTYASPVGSNSLLKEDRCLTCVFDNCTYQGKTTVSTGDEIHIDFSCKGPGQFYQAIINLNASMHPDEMQIITVPSAKKINLPKWKTESFNLSSGYEALTRIYFGDTKLASVPVALVVYGGPDMNQVADKFEAFPKPMGYSSHAIVYIDVRGSGGRGWKYRSPVYGRLATVEVEDTLEAMKLVLAKYPKMDPNRVAVFGWSYGGTMAARLVEIAPASFFKCAISVAPVSNFLYYDATYTERFMGDAARSSYVDLSTDVSKFAHTKLLLVHGLRDDNVHFQNSAFLIEALQQANIPFQMMVYPNQGHSISHNYNHLANLFESFLTSCFT